MAFFSWFGKSDNEDFGAFHVKCGKDLTFSKERRTARAPFASARIVYSVKSIPTGGMFQVKVLEKGYHPLVSDLWEDEL